MVNKHASRKLPNSKSTSHCSVKGFFCKAVNLNKFECFGGKISKAICFSLCFLKGEERY